MRVGVGLVLEHILVVVQRLDERVEEVVDGDLVHVVSVRALGRVHHVSHQADVATQHAVPVYESSKKNQTLNFH